MELTPTVAGGQFQAKSKLPLVLLAQFCRHRRQETKQAAGFHIELGGNLVAHSAITEGTRKFFRVQLLGKAQVDVAGIIENFDLIW